eukprot:4615628-Alexandrium_andersonii.AAC.1
MTWSPRPCSKLAWKRRSGQALRPIGRRPCCSSFRAGARQWVPWGAAQPASWPDGWTKHRAGR